MTPPCIAYGIFDKNIILNLFTPSKFRSLVDERIKNNYTFTEGNVSIGSVLIVRSVSL